MNETDIDIEDLPDLNSGTPWSEMDLIDLANCVRLKDPVEEIASFLRRSRREVREKIAPVQGSDPSAKGRVRARTGLLCALASISCYISAMHWQVGIFNTRASCCAPPGVDTGDGGSFEKIKAHVDFPQHDLWRPRFNRHGRVRGAFSPAEPYVIERRPTTGRQIQSSGQSPSHRDAISSCHPVQPNTARVRQMDDAFARTAMPRRDHVPSL